VFMSPSWSSTMDDHSSFYNSVTQPVGSTTDAAVARTLMNKTEDEPYNLIEEMAPNNF